MTETCETCRFYQNGWCRRFPPVWFEEVRRGQYDDLKVGVWSWPAVDLNEWCGEHSAKVPTPSEESK